MCRAWWLVAFGAGLMTSARAAELASYDVVRDVVYCQRASEPLKADLYVPKGAGPFPGVLVVHGGAWMAGDRYRMQSFCRELASAGMTAATIDYRLAPRHPFPAQLEDCQSAVSWLGENAGAYKVDPNRLGGLGYSAGGHLVALLATVGADADGKVNNSGESAPRLRCVVAGGAPCDFRQLPANSRGMAYWLGGTRREKPDAYRLASPAAFVSRDDPPILFFHGETDSLVPIDGARQMVEACQQAGVAARLYTVEGVGHVQAIFDRGARQESIRFLQEHLGVGAQRPVASRGGS